MAANDNTLLDGNGDDSDWIEIYNPTDQTIDLTGWHLTDDPSDLSQWTFPNAPVVPQEILELAPDEYLVVFASGQDTADYVDPAENLHTNFALRAEGEYLALVQPDGVTIEHAYDPGYPEQLTDISYGLVQVTDPCTFIGPDAEASYQIPVDGTLGDTWTSTAYDDTAWATGETAFGFGSNSSDLELYLPFDATSGSIAVDLSGNGNDGTIYDADWLNDPTRGQVLDFDSNNDYVLASLPGLTSEFTIAFWARQTAYTDNNEGLFQAQNGGSSPNTDYKVVGGWVNTSTGYPWGRIIELDGSTRNLPQVGPVISLNTWTHYAYRGDGSTYQLFVNGNPGPQISYDGTIALNDRIFIGKQGTESWRGQIDDFAVWSSALSSSNIAALASGSVTPEAFSDFAEIIQTDLTAAMLDQVASSAYLRFHFELDTTDFDIMTLQMRYDDGFVAYLNGTPIASRNAPSTPAWNDTATAEQPNSQALQFEEIDVSPFMNLLGSGDNVLAIHGLNLTGTDNDFLLDVQLEAVHVLQEDIRYMVDPTPGAPNGQGYFGFLGDTQFDVDRGFFEDPFTVSIISTDPDAAVYYTTDGSEPSPTHPTATLYSSPVPITKTTMLRAGAFQDGYLPTNIDTQTYIFLEDVLVQDPLNDPSAPDYPTTWQAGATGDYAIDSEVVTAWDDNNPVNTDYGIREALLSIPTMSIVMDHADLWDAANGIYPNAINTGTAWLRPGSIEYIDPNTGATFQYNVGVQMHGHASRDNVRLKKHSFRLIFSNDFDGPSTLPYQLFEDSELDSINTLVLRACFTDSFATRTITDRYSPLDSTYTRDVWVRDTQLAMGHLSAHSTYVHLYINGLYWGLYDPAERPDDAFMAAYFGGAREDWDIIKDFNELFRGDKTTWNAMFDLANQLPGAADPDTIYWQLQGKNPDGTTNAALPNYLDMENLIDFMILHLYAGAEDWPHHNWYAARNRVDPGAGFKFFVWDQEIVLDGRFRDRTNVDSDGSPAELYDLLRYSPEFRLHFADRIQWHMHGDGALTTSANQARWNARADEVEAAILGESARWGDAREGEVVTIDSGAPAVTIPTMTIDHWRGSSAEVLGYFAQSHALAMSRFRGANLYPAVDAPTFNQYGGAVPSGFQLQITNNETTGRIYYTLDGSDPRAVGGGVADSAIAYAGPITLTESHTIITRLFQNGVWSARVEAEFLVGLLADATNLRITEINYNPHTAYPQFGELDVDKDQFEFIELMNVSSTKINLINTSFGAGIDYTFEEVTLDPDARIVVVRDSAAFVSRYGTGLPIAGEFANETGLSNSGETIQLVDAFGGTILEFAYNDGGRSDGLGSALEILHTDGDYNANSNWQASTAFGGTPGTEPIDTVDILINEVAAHTDLPQLDSIELYNRSAAEVDLGSWWLSDSTNNYFKYQFPAMTTMAAGSYLVLDEQDFNAGGPENPVPFALDSAGDQIWLLAADSTGRPLRFADGLTFAATLNGVTLGRIPNGDPTMDLFPLAAPSLGTTNGPHQAGSLILSELHYHPSAPPIGATITEQELEFVELYNRSDQAIVLHDSSLGGWRLRGGIDFDFDTLPIGASIAAGTVWVLVPFDPTDPIRSAEFRSIHGIDASAPLVGPYANQLDNGGETVRLLAPTDPPFGEPDPIHYLVDRVTYDDTAPWPTEPNGSGPALARLGAETYGDLAAHWIAAMPTPGTVTFVPPGPGDFDTDGDVDSIDRALWELGFGMTAGARLVDGDADADSDVDGNDFLIWQQNFNSHSAGQGAVELDDGSLLEPPNHAGKPLRIANPNAESQKLATSDRPADTSRTAGKQSFSIDPSSRWQWIFMAGSASGQPRHRQQGQNQRDLEDLSRPNRSTEPNGYSIPEQNIPPQNRSVLTRALDRIWTRVGSH